jgi:sodium/proline symporter
MNSIAISFTVYTLVVLIFGIYSARYARKSSADFFLAGRGLGPWVTALSYSASAESGWVTLGLVGMAFHTGAAALWILPGTLAAITFSWWILGNRLRNFARKRDAITLPEVMASLKPDGHAKKIRWLAVLIIILMLTVYVAAQLTAAAKTFEATFGWHYGLGVGIGAGIVLTYTILGGFRAVAWTDVLQATLMIAAVVILPLVLVFKLGGFGAMWSQLAAMDESGALVDPLAGRTGLALLGFFSLWLGIPFGYPGQPHILVRFMAARDEQSIRRGAFIANGWVFVLFTGAVLLGMAARAYYGELPDAEKALPIAAADLLPGWLAGMMIAAVLAAICSTADSQLLVCASSVSHDLIGKLFRKQSREKAVIMVHRLTLLFIGLVAGAIALSESRVIFHFVLYAWAGLGAAFGPAMILGLMWKRVTGMGLLAGMVAGFASAIIWVEVPWLKSMAFEMIPAFLIALLTTVLVSLATQGINDSD